MEDCLPFSKQKTFDRGENLVCQFRLAWDPWTPSWEISGRQGEWHPPPSELCYFPIFFQLELHLITYITNPGGNQFGFASDDGSIIQCRQVAPVNPVTMLPQVHTNLRYEDWQKTGRGNVSKGSFMQCILQTVHDRFTRCNHSSVIRMDGSSNMFSRFSRSEIATQEPRSKPRW